MKKISDYVVNEFLYKEEKPNEDEKEIMIFGITRIIEDITKFVIIFFICYLLNILNEFGVVVAVTLIYKLFIGGAHARSNIECLIVSTIYFILPIILAKYVSYDLSIFYIISLIVGIFSAYVIINKAPADTEEIPIINKKRRKELKIGGCISLIILLIIAQLLTKEILYAKIIIYTIFLIDLFTLSVMYRLLRCKSGRESDEYRDLY